MNGNTDRQLLSEIPSLLSYYFIEIEVNDKKFLVYKSLVRTYLEVVHKQDLGIDDSILDMVKEEITNLAIENDIGTFEKMEQFLIHEILKYTRNNPQEGYYFTSGNF